jgi:hypothetical protein
MHKRLDDTAKVEQEMQKRRAKEGYGTPGQPVNEADQGKETKRFSFRPAGELLTVKPIEWLIRGYLEAGTLAVLFGDPETLKSFIALDMACSIATFTSWHGKFTKKGPVFIIIGEGVSGYGRRLAAWQKERGRYLEGAPIFVSTVPAQITDEKSAEEVAAAIQRLKEDHGDPVLLIIDTLARNFGPGDENSTADMTKFINHLDRHIGNTFTRLLVHHSGLVDKSRGRGSSVLRGAVDVELKATKNSDGTVELSCSKMKDAPPFAPITFKPEVVELGVDDIGDPITSLCLHRAEKAEQQAPTLSPQHRMALSLLDLMNRKSGISCVSEWMNLCREEEVYTKSAFYNAAKTLEMKNIIKITDGYVKRY